jgi:PAS domain S-box-containing protein
MVKKPTRNSSSSAPSVDSSTQDAAFYATVLSNLPGMAYRMLNQPNWPAEFISEGSLALTGYAPADLLAGGERAYGDLIHPDDQKYLWDGVQAALDNHQSFGLTYRIHTADGTLKWVFEQGGGIYDEDGNLLSLAGFITDVTQRRTAEIEVQKRAAELQTVAEVGTAATTILDPDQLLAQVVELTKTDFDLYHAHIYLIDDAGENLVLAAGAGEAGKQMKAQGWQIAADNATSLVARAFRTRAGVIVNDVREAPDFLPNPLLPDTRAELAVPLIVGERVLGVLDVQSARVGRFTAEDIAIQTTLAGQIAAALQNARIVEAVERQRALYDGILTNLPTAVFAVDSQFNLLVTNEAAQQLLGRQMTDKEGNAYVEQYDVVYYDTSERFPEGELPLVKANTQGGQHVNNDLAVRHPDGALVPLMINAGPLLDPSGQQMGAVVTFTDMTAQRQAEESILQNEARLRDAQEVANVGSWDYDMITDTLTWSDQTYRVYGRDPQTFKVTFANVVAHYPPGDQEAVLAAFQKSIQEQTDLVIEHRIVTGTNEIRFVLERGRTTYAEDGAPLRMVGTVADITERKQAEAERERFTTRLNTAAQIAERVGSILDPDELLRTVIPLIKEQFGLYYVHVYTLDEAAGTLNLRAGYGEAGEKMLAEGHSIPLDREASLVATAARTGESVLVQDVTANPDFLPNPLLPDTKSEVAVPAIAGGKVLGVFDVQHDEKDYFTDADLDVFQTLAGQIATALQNARLFEQLNITQFSVDRGPVAIYLMRPDASLYDVNETACQMLGYTREELLAFDKFTDLDPNFPPKPGLSTGKRSRKRSK